MAGIFLPLGWFRSDDVDVAVQLVTFIRKGEVDDEKAGSVRIVECEWNNSQLAFTHFNASHWKLPFTLFSSTTFFF